TYPDCCRPAGPEHRRPASRPVTNFVEVDNSEGCGCETVVAVLVHQNVSDRVDQRAVPGSGEAAVNAGTRDHHYRILGREQALCAGARGALTLRRGDDVQLGGNPFRDGAVAALP